MAWVKVVSCVISAPQYSTLLVAEARSGSGGRERVRGERLVAGGPFSQPSPVWQRTRAQPQQGWTQVRDITCGYNEQVLSCHQHTAVDIEGPGDVLWMSLDGLDADITQWRWAAVWGRLRPRGRSLPWLSDKAVDQEITICHYIKLTWRIQKLHWWQEKIQLHILKITCNFV